MRNRVNASEETINYSKPYSSNVNNKMKAKRIRKKDANIDNTKMCYQRGN